MKKEKEKIKTQIIKSLEVYKGGTGFDFFDSSNSTSKPKIAKLDENDLEVLLMKFDERNWILLTTKCIFISRDTIIERIEGLEIENFDFVNLKNGRTKEKASEFEKPGDYKRWLYSGDFEIIKTDKRASIVNLPNHVFGSCLLNGIKKLKFVSNKYEGF
jgi:hypothetical protein